MNPEMVTADVAVEKVDIQAEEPKTLEQVIDAFKALRQGADNIIHSKDAEYLKSSFYKILGKLKSEAEDVLQFEKMEETFKELYGDYKRDRSEFNKKQEEERENNLKEKKSLIEELKGLVEGQDDVSASFPKLREIQAKWRETGPVPVQNYRDINDTYQFYVEKFYDMVKINHELRDLDFRKNLEAKQAFCEAAEKLSENENVVNAFHELQKLHEQWKEFGPVAKEFREDIWNRFKVATAVINKKYQAHFEELKSQQSDNLLEKTKLCEQAEAIAEKEVSGSNEWNSLTKEIEEIQVKWRGIGFASKKDNQKIYDRFRAACDKFFDRKRQFYAQYKDSMNGNLEKKLSIIEQAEQLKSNTDWKKTTDQFISLQKQWKEIGAVPRKKSEQLWKRFRAACDDFFAERDKNAKPENDFYGNLKLKKKLIEEIKAFEGKAEEEIAAAFKDFNERWQAIGFVPYKEKDGVFKSFKEAMQSKFPAFYQKASAGQAKVLSAKESLIQRYNSLQQDIVTYENNIGFFSASKNSEPLIQQMRERIEAAKAELKDLEKQIRKSEEEGQ